MHRLFLLNRSVKGCHETGLWSVAGVSGLMLAAGSGIRTANARSALLLLSVYVSDGEEKYHCNRQYSDNGCCIHYSLLLIYADYTP
jgi:hypothetical protein